MRIGYFLSTEEQTPRALIDQAEMAQISGFDSLWISDHFHPWNDQQGQSPFVWAVIGAVSQVCDLPVTTAVTCPTTRIHPVIVAQAAATAAVMLDGNFRLGVGSGEALNEHVTGAIWPNAEVRLEMLEEAVDIIRRLLTEDVVNHHGQYYTVEDARLYTKPERPFEIPMSGFGPKAIEVAAKIADGFISTKLDTEAIKIYRAAGGKGQLQGGYKVCWARTEEAGIETAHRLWPISSLPGELAQVLPSPRHFEQAAEMVTEDQIRQAAVCGPDAKRHVAKMLEYFEAGYDEVYVSQMGPEQEEFFKFYKTEVLPEVRRQTQGIVDVRERARSKTVR